MIYQQPLIQGHQLSQILKDDLDPRIIFQDSVDILGIKMLGRVIRIWLLKDYSCWRADDEDWESKGHAWSLQTIRIMTNLWLLIRIMIQAMYDWIFTCSSVLDIGSCSKYNFPSSTSKITIVSAFRPFIPGMWEWNTYLYIPSPQKLKVVIRRNRRSPLRTFQHSLVRDRAFRNPKDDREREWPIINSLGILVSVAPKLDSFDIWRRDKL